MATIDRAFRVIVLGGIALATVPVGACGGVADATDDGGTNGHSDGGAPNDADMRDAFPSETGAQLDAANFPDEGVPVDAFPQEGPALIDASVADAAVVDATGIADAFPQETAQQVDP
jgi:hypothetical protein